MKQLREDIELSLKDLNLRGFLTVPPDAKGIVLFAHGSGSSRFSSRNIFVSEELNKANLATLLMDLLTEEEEEIDTITRDLRFNIPLLAQRLSLTSDWLTQYPKTKLLNIGYFGASTGAAAALASAAEKKKLIKAVVSRGGRPDLASQVLHKVEAPTLLIVGGHDEVVLDLNKSALAKLNCEKKLEIIPGATHLFEESGALEQVAELSRQWFSNYL